jgi:hypothetical protein
MSPLQELQKWYRSQCNGEWEHGYGVEIGTLDNPGWSLNINLAETCLADKEFTSYSYGADKQSDPKDEEWIFCEKKDKQFKAAGGPYKLEEMITDFLKWKDSFSG